MPLESIMLERTARRIVDVAVQVKPGENVCIVTDTNKISIAEALARASYGAGAEVVVCVMTPRQAHNNEPPAVIAAAMKAAHAVIVPATYKLGHTQASKAAMEAGARIFMLGEITEETFTTGGITADPEEVSALTNKLADRLDRASEIRMTTSLGSNIRMSKGKNKALRVDGMLREGGMRIAGLPTGEAAITPTVGTAEGTIIVDHAIDNIGALSEPVKLTVVKGRIVKIEGGKEAKRLEEIVRTNENGDYFAEFAIGTNPCSRMLGIVAEDKVRLGCVHVAVGANLVLGGDVVSPIHLDLVILKPTVYLDGEEIVRQGKLLLVH